ncbi:MAG: c-type cytochrome [Rhodospirillales bacterium]|nr:c-type cytochrome [Rhodospirillales bacterium]
MSRWREMSFGFVRRAALVAVFAAAVASGASAADKYPGVGRAATPAEVEAWDIDVRPDFQGLPKGSGTVEKGQEIWEAKCASCHGTFGESNKVFTPLIGGTTKEDVEKGRVASLLRPDYPQRTTFMKVPTISTLFDYIRRAMPWNEPKSLTPDEVYSVLDFMLNLAEIVPDDFVLDDQSIREVQKRMPNRNGMSTNHALWPGAGFGTEKKKADTANTACMKDCGGPVQITSTLPDHAWTAHGNLASQNRRIGPVRGRVTGNDDPDAIDEPGPAGFKLAQSAGCMGCHGLNNKIVGPSYVDVAAKYKDKDMLDTLVGRVVKGGEGVWGEAAMPPQEGASEGEIKTIVEWILAGAPGR